MPVRNRIKGHVRVRAGDLVPHELNPRLHSEAQRAGPGRLYDEVGFARCLLAYELPDGRLKLIDGHLRQSTWSRTWKWTSKSSTWTTPRPAPCCCRSTRWRGWPTTTAGARRAAEPITTPTPTRWPTCGGRIRRGRGASRSR